MIPTTYRESVAFLIYERKNEHYPEQQPTSFYDDARRLQAMVPEAAAQLRAAAAQGTLLGWTQVRCASLDRLPLVGAVPDVAALHSRMEQAGSRRGRVALEDTPRWPGLFMLGALGSRGLTLSHWCAHLLAAQIERESLDGVAPDLVQALDPARFAWRQARKQPTPHAAQPQTA